MELIKFNEQEYLGNISWETRKAKKEFDKAFKEAINSKPEAKYAIITEYNNEVSFALLKTDKKPTKKSATVYLANANAMEYGGSERGLAWVYVQRLDQDSYWVSTVLNGLPYNEAVVQSGDLIDTISSSITALDVMGDEMGGRPTITVYTSSEDLQIHLSSTFSDKSVSFFQKDFEDLIATGSYKAKIKSTSNLGKTLGIAALVAALVAAGYFIYDYWEKMQEEHDRMVMEQNAAESEEALKRAQEKYEQDKLEAIKKAKEEAIESMNKKLTSPKLEEVLNSWTGLVGNEKTVVQGWTRVGATCQLDKNEPYCVYNFDRSQDGNVGTIASFVKQYNDVGIEIMTNGNKAEVKRIANIIEPVQGDYNSLKDFNLREFQIDTLSKLQILELNDIENDVKVPLLVETEIKLPPPPKGIKQQMDDLEKITLGIEEGDFALKGRDFYKLQSLYTELGKIEKPFIIKSVDLSMVGNEYAWVVKGKYFVQSGKHESNLDTIETKIPKSEIIKNK